MKLAPDRKKFMEVIGGSGDINADIEKFCTLFPPLLQENHKFLVRYCIPNHIKISEQLPSFSQRLMMLCVVFLLQASVGLDDMKAS